MPNDRNINKIKTFLKHHSDNTLTTYNSTQPPSWSCHGYGKDMKNR